MRHLFVLTLLASFSVSACRVKHESTPEETFREFVRAAREGHRQKAYAMLSSETRAALEKKRASVERAIGAGLVEDAGGLTFDNRWVEENVSDVSVAEASPRRVVVTMKVGGQIKTQQLVREQDQWKVDWTSLLYP